MDYFQTKKVYIALAGLLLTCTGTASATGLSLGAATGYNALVFSDFTEYYTDSEGRLAVGGNFAPTGGAGFTIASLHSGDAAGVYDLVVGGNFTNTYASMGGGDVFVGGNMTWAGPTLPHNAYINGNFSNPAYGGSTGGTIYYAGSYSSNTALAHSKVATPTAAPLDFLSAKTSLQSLSVSLASQVATAAVLNNGYGTYTLTGASSTTNVFNMTDTTYNGKTINISAPAGSTVIVNVAGTSDSFSGGSINISGIDSHSVIFNFNSATTLAIGSIAFNGTILAPNANVTGTYGQLNGQLIANSLAGTTELHDVLFTGTLPTSTTNAQIVSSTPEPSTWLLFLGATGFWFFRRERLVAFAKSR